VNTTLPKKVQRYCDKEEFLHKMPKSSKYKSRAVNLDKAPDTSSNRQSAYTMAPPNKGGPSLMSAVLPSDLDRTAVDYPRDLNEEPNFTVMVGEHESAYNYSKGPKAPKYPSNPNRESTVLAPAYQSHQSMKSSYKNPQAVHHEYQYQSYVPQAHKKSHNQSSTAQYGNVPQQQQSSRKQNPPGHNNWIQDTHHPYEITKTSKKKKKKYSSSSSSNSYSYSESSLSSSFENFAENHAYMTQQQQQQQSTRSKRPLKALRQVYMENKGMLAEEYPRWTDRMPFDDRTVLINVYHLSPELKKLNKLNNKLGMNMGLYHASVEIGGYEWAYGGTTESRCGIYKEKARSSDQFEFDEAIYVGQLPAHLSMRNVKDLEKSMRPSWNGIDYDLTQKNCISFVHAFIERLGFSPKRIPSRLRVLMDMGNEVGSGPTGVQLGAGIDKLANFLGNMLN